MRAHTRNRAIIVRNGVACGTHVFAKLKFANFNARQNNRLYGRNKELVQTLACIVCKVNICMFLISYACMCAALQTQICILEKYLFTTVV